MLHHRDLTMHIPGPRNAKTGFTIEVPRHTGNMAAFGFGATPAFQRAARGEPLPPGSRR
jgi:hypothetical protein